MDWQGVPGTLCEPAACPSLLPTTPCALNFLLAQSKLEEDQCNGNPSLPPVLLIPATTVAVVDQEAVERHSNSVPIISLFASTNRQVRKLACSCGSR